MPDRTGRDSTPHFLRDGGVSGETARAFDWPSTRLGPPETWPQSLATTVGILLHSRHPMFLWWGEDLIQIYNDAYLPSFGVGKHPQAMGQKGRDCWPEIWPIIGPQIEDVMLRGQASWNEDALVPIFRNGRIEEVYWTYGYSPVFDEGGVVGGTLVVCTETTGRVLAERRLQLMRSLTSALASASDLEEVIDIAAAALDEAPRDIPFASIFADGRVRTAGLDAAIAASLEDTLGGRLGRAERIVLPTPVSAASSAAAAEVLVIPLDASGAAMVFGLSPRLPFDDAYQNFLRQIVGAVANARARARLEIERRDLLMQAPVATALVTGPDHVFGVANPLYCAMVGRRDLVGKAFFDAFPELRGTLLPILDRVYGEGVPFVTNELRLPLDRGRGAIEDAFFKFNLEPIRNLDGNVYGMMAVAVDITEQVTARRELEQRDRERERLLVEAEAANRAKDEFLAMLGHELRNPLAPIVTAVELLKLRGYHSREREVIERQARHLVHLVDDLLDVARVAQGKIELERSRVALADVVARAVETASLLFEQKSQRLEIEVPLEGLDVDADLVRLCQVVANLLTNAAKFTHPGGRIQIRAERVGDEAVVRVADDGAGIAPEQLPHLFERFFQGPRASDRAEGGLGLGLALVRSLAALHGGSVTAHSAGLGHGSVFELRIPCADHDATSAVAEPTAGAEVRAPAPEMRVLMVDDNADIAEVFATLLATFGFEVRTAHDAPSALDVAEVFRPTVAILDIGLPVMDGYELATRLRERLGDAAPRLIAMTGYGQAQDRENTRRAGFERHLVKPVDVYALVEAIAAPPG